MKKSIFYAVLLGSLVLLAGCGEREISKEEQKAIQTLEMINASIRANMAVIQTWQGEAAVTYIKDGRATESELKFAIDNKNDRLYQSYRQIKNWRGTHLNYEITIITPEKYIQRR